MSLWFRIQAFARSFSLYIWVPMCLLRMLWQVSTWYAEVCCRVVFTTILGFLFLPQSGRNALLCMMQNTLMWFVDTGKNTATARVSVGATMKSCVLCHAKQESKQNVRCKFVAPSWRAHVGQFRMESVTTLRAPNKPCLPLKHLHNWNAWLKYVYADPQSFLLCYAIQGNRCFGWMCDEANNRTWAIDDVHSSWCTAFPVLWCEFMQGRFANAVVAILSMSHNVPGLICGCSRRLNLRLSLLPWFKMPCSCQKKSNVCNIWRTTIVIGRKSPLHLECCQSSTDTASMVLLPSK